MAGLLGVERERRADFEAWAGAYLDAISGGDEARLAAALGPIENYFVALLSLRRRELEAAPEDEPEDMLGIFALARHLDDSPFLDDELFPLFVLLLAGGSDTTRYLITACVHRLLEAPDRWKAVVEEPSLIEVVVEETLRFDAPVAGVFRTNNLPERLDDVELPPDTKVQFLIGAAGRDPAVFDDPHEYRLDRDLDALRRDNLAFGFGAHFCVGAALARLGARVALTALVERIPTLELAAKPPPPQPYLVPSTIPRGLTELRARWSPT
jgi:cytochrome P450